MKTLADLDYDELLERAREAARLPDLADGAELRVDVNPLSEGGKHFWTKTAEGLAKWATHLHPWQALYDHIIKWEGMTPAYAKRIAGEWYFEVFGHGPTAGTGHRGLGLDVDGEDDYVGLDVIDTEVRSGYGQVAVTSDAWLRERANVFLRGLPDAPRPVDALRHLDDDAKEYVLAVALYEIDLENGHLRAFDPGKHRRWPKGHPQAGKFRPMIDLLKAAIADFDPKKDKHPFTLFKRPQLLKAARDLGVKLDRGEHEDSIAAKLLAHLNPNAKAPQVPVRGAKEIQGDLKSARLKRDRLRTQLDRAKTPARESALLRQLEEVDDEISKLERELEQSADKAPAAKNSRPRRQPKTAKPTRVEVKAAEEHANALGMSKNVSWAHREQVARELTRQAKLTPRSMRQLDSVHLPKKVSDDGQAYRDSKNGKALAYYSALGSHPSVYATQDAATDNPRPAIWLNPDWDGDHGLGAFSASRSKSDRSGWKAPTQTETPMAAVLAHEYGHHVANVFAGEIDPDGTADMPTDIGLRFLPVLNDALGAKRFADDDFSTNRPDRDLLAPVEFGFKGDMKSRISGGVLENWRHLNRELIAEKVSGYAATNFGELLAEIWAEYSTKGKDARPHIKIIGDLMREISEEVRA